MEIPDIDTLNVLPPEQMLDPVPFTQAFDISILIPLISFPQSVEVVKISQTLPAVMGVIELTSQINEEF